MSRLNEYLESVISKNILSDLNQQFKKLKYETELEDDLLTVTNKYKWQVNLRINGSNIIIFTQGYKNDIEVDVVKIKDGFNEVKKSVNSVNMTWIKENDPDSDRW